MNRRILVVDDDQPVRFAVGKMLEKAGFEVSLAENGVRCIETLKAGFKGLILMDVMMPDMDGWETIEAIVEQGLISGNVICMMTALQEPDPKMEVVKEYVLDYLRKPFTTAEMLHKVEPLLDILSAGSAT